MPNDNVLTDAKVRAAIKHAEEEISRMAPFSSLEERRFAFCRALLTAHPGQSKPCASAGVIAAARAVIEADRAQTLTTEHVNALDNAIKIQRDELNLPEPRAEVTNTAEAAFEAFAARYDQESNEWLDMDAQQTFIHGWNAARTGASS